MSVLRYLIVFVVIAMYTGRITSEYFTSISGMDALLEAEGHLVNLLEDHIKRTDTTLDEELLERMSHVKEEYNEAKNDLFEYVSNPITAFKLIKRFLFEWTKFMEYIQDDVGVYLTRVMNVSFEPPTDDDLTGAAFGLNLLQKTYLLNVTELADGKIMGVKYGLAMSATDCMELGLALYRGGLYGDALPWLLEARDKFKKLKSLNTETVINLVQYLSYIYINLRQPKMALPLLFNMIKFNLQSKVNETLSKETTMEELCAMTCRGERHQTPSEQRPLRCMYTANGVPHRLIGPFKMEQLNLDPPVLYYYQAISDDEMKYVLQQYKSKIKRSEILDGYNAPVLSFQRTSKTGWTTNDDFKFLGKLLLRLKDMTGLATESDMQVVNYGIGGHYEVHWDFLLDRKIGGDRLATGLLYVNDVELGGATAFPYLKLAVPPLKGGMVLWYNFHESLAPDYRTAHTGCPVLKGSKWILTHWFSTLGNELTRPCSSEKQGYKSMKYRQMSVVNV